MAEIFDIDDCLENITTRIAFTLVNYKCNIECAQAREACSYRNGQERYAANDGPGNYCNTIVVGCSCLGGARWQNVWSNPVAVLTVCWPLNIDDGAIVPVRIKKRRKPDILLG